jgi:methionyl-tRNA synthetase
MMRIVTCALPYANGDLHLGHLLEHVMSDIHVRTLRARNEEVLFACAEDAHGTAIEIAAHKRGITPEALIADMQARHRADIDAYAISFDAFHTTHSTENRTLAESFYAAFKEAGMIEHREIEQYFDAKAGRFLPDRFIKGTCPKCSTPDQNGDSCDACGAHYKPTELIDPRSVLSGTPPVRRTSTHAFFLLSELHEEARAFIAQAQLQSEIVNYIEHWIDEGLADWDVARDGPYFGFPIPGEYNQYFYVWLDAPIGYLATVESWACERGLDNPWNDAHITHVIGKDLIYFHFLFWPQMLRIAGYKQPDRIHVHGFLTVNGEKMSKSRGTFVLASELAERYDPNLIRYYLARKASKTSVDDDFTFEELENRVNSELIGNLLNLAYRTLTLITKRSEPITLETLDATSTALITATLEQRSRFEALALDFDISHATDEMLRAGDLVNAYLQKREPWKEADNTTTLATAWLAYQPILDMLEIITPQLARELRSQFSTERSDASDAQELIEAYRERIGYAQPRMLVRRIERIEHPIETLDLRIARIERARAHPNADSLYLLDVDLGDEKRTIVSGLKNHYALEELEGRHIIVVTNLKPALIRGEKSEGMLLAGCTTHDEHVVLAEPSGAVGERIRAGGRSAPSDEVDLKAVVKAGIRVEKGIVRTDIGALRSLSGPVTCRIDDGAIVR